MVRWPDLLHKRRPPVKPSNSLPRIFLFNISALRLSSISHLFIFFLEKCHRCSMRGSRALMYGPVELLARASLWSLQYNSLRVMYAVATRSWQKVCFNIYKIKTSFIRIYHMNWYIINLMVFDYPYYQKALGVLSVKRGLTRTPYHWYFPWPIPEPK